MPLSSTDHAPFRNHDFQGEAGAARRRNAAAARAASGRRRGVDPTTCDRDYSAEELEFMGAMERYKGEAGRPFPTWSEALSVARSLGYRRDAAPASDG